MRRVRRASSAFAALALLAAPARAEVLVAVAAPLTGPYRAMGEEVSRAVEAAAADLNAKGGVLGEQIVLAVEDDGCDRGVAEATARALAARKPALAIGHPCSPAAIAAAPVYAASELLFITPGARHPAFTERRAGPTVFRLAGRDDRQGEAAARWLIGAASGGRIALVHDQSTYARGLANETARALRTSGSIGNVSVVSIVGAQLDYSATAARLAHEHVEAVFFAGYPTEAALVLDALFDKGLATPFLGSDSLATSEFGAVTAKRTAPTRVLIPDNVTLAIRARAAIEAWAAAAKRAGSLASDRLARTLSETEIATEALGPLRFDGNGDARIVSHVPARWNGERWTVGD